MFIMSIKFSALSLSRGTLLTPLLNLNLLCVFLLSSRNMFVKSFHLTWKTDSTVVLLHTIFNYIWIQTMQCINTHQCVGTAGSCVVCNEDLRASQGKQLDTTETEVSVEGARAAVCLFLLLLRGSRQTASSLQASLCDNLLSTVGLWALQVDTLGVC